uniref:Uncharacterized protein n=1 Tax=viral metagenome TaxID=1070528 RepID=A0A6C0ADY8_9ZZZZ
MESTKLIMSTSPSQIKKNIFFKTHIKINIIFLSWIN